MNYSGGNASVRGTYEKDYKMIIVEIGTTWEFLSIPTLCASRPPPHTLHSNLVGLLSAQSSHFEASPGIVKCLRRTGRGCVGTG